MPKYTDEQIERAQNIDVVSFLMEKEKYTFTQSGKYMKCLHPNATGQPSSLSIDTEINRIFYNSVTGSRPLSALDWCMSIRNMDFKSSMELVLGEEPDGTRTERTPYKPYRPQKHTQVPDKDFVMPEKSDTNRHVYAYLTISRGISENIVKDCIKNNLIIEDNRKNAVFLGYDENNTVKYGARRGTITIEGFEPFKRDCIGSDKKHAFKLVGKNTDTVYVTEAAIDALSLATLEDRFHGDGAYKNKTYITTGGAGIDNALENFCKTHNVKTINVCFDNDEAGINGMEKIKQKYSAMGYEVNDMRASLAHDYNDELIGFIKNPNFYTEPPKPVKSDKIIERNDNMPEKTPHVPQEYSNSTPEEISPETNAYYNSPPPEEEIPPETNPYYNSPPPEDEIPPEMHPYYNNPPQEENIPPEQNNFHNNSLSESNLQDTVINEANKTTDRTADNSMSRQQKTAESEKTALFSIKQNGELYYYSTEKTANELLHISANNKEPFAEMMNQGKRISKADYKEIMQSDKLKYALDLNFDGKTANIFAINNGRGGIAEENRNTNNTMLKSVNLSAFVRKEANRDMSEQQGNNHIQPQVQTERPAQAETIPDIPKAEKDLSAVDNTEKKEANHIMTEQQEIPEKAADKKAEISPSEYAEKEPHNEEKPTVRNITAEGLDQLQPEEKMNFLLATMKDNYEKKQSVILDKIDRIDSKIERQNNRIDKLKAKVEDIETSLKTLNAFKRAFSNTPIGALIDNQIEKKQAKIVKIKDVKIPKREQKIRKQNVKKSKTNIKLGKVNRKIDKIDKALGNKDREKRHQGFVTGLENLSDIRKENYEIKAQKITRKISKLTAEYNSPDISHRERLEIGNKIKNLRVKSAKISEKIKGMETLYKDLDDIKNGKLTNEEIEQAVNKTAGKISEKLERNKDTDTKDIVDKVIDTSVDSGSEAISEVNAEKAVEKENSKPDIDRERLPEEREPEVSETAEQKILSAVAVITGIDISEINRLPAEIKADIISEFRENSGNLTTEKLAERICNIADITPRKTMKQAEPDVSKADTFEKSNSLKQLENNLSSEKLKEKDVLKDAPLFSRARIMSDEFKPVSSKSQEDIEKDKNKNHGMEL